MPNWTKQAIDEYARSGEVDASIVFRRMNKSGRITVEQMSEQAIYNTLRQWAYQRLRLMISGTFAKLAYKGDSGLDQIQLSLGHGSIQTTERYLGVEKDLTDARCDRLGLRL